MFIFMSTALLVKTAQDKRVCSSYVSASAYFVHVAPEGALPKVYLQALYRKFRGSVLTNSAASYVN